MAAPGRAEETGGPGAGTVCVRLPAKPMKSVTVRKPPGLENQKRWPGRRRGSRLTARKANKFGFRTQTPGPEIQKRRPGCRRGSRLTSRKVNKLGFFARTTGPENQKRRPGCRHGLRTPARKANKFGFLARTPGREFQNRRPENGKTLYRQQRLDDAGFSRYLLLPLRAVLGLILELGRLLQLDFCGHFFAVPLHSEGDGVSHLLLLNGLN